MFSKSLCGTFGMCRTLPLPWQIMPHLLLHYIILIVDHGHESFDSLIIHKRMPMAITIPIQPLNALLQD